MMKRLLVFVALVAVVTVVCSSAIAQNTEDLNPVVRTKHSLWALLGGSRLVDMASKTSNPGFTVGLNRTGDLQNPADPGLLNSTPTIGDINSRTLIPLITSASSAPVTVADVLDVIETNNKDGGGGSGGRPFASPTYPWAQPTPP